jgi:CRISPR-associated exonuclease Cas4
MTWADETVIPISAIEHHEYCPRQCALIFIDGLWEENPHTIAGGRAHRRVDSGSSRTERGRLVLRTIPLWSEGFGLSGRADAVEIERDGRVTPVEYKSGVRHGRTADLQLCAQALCLEEMLGVEIPQGYIWYGAWRRRWPVAIDDELRRTTVGAIGAIRALLVEDALPAAPADERCRTCQLEGHCLPDVVASPGRIASYVEEEVLGCAT